MRKLLLVGLLAALLMPVLASASATELREDQTLRIPGAIETRSCGACYHRPSRRRAGPSAEKSCK